MAAGGRGRVGTQDRFVGGRTGLHSPVSWTQNSVSTGPLLYTLVNFYNYVAFLL